MLAAVGVAGALAWAAYAGRERLWRFFVAPPKALVTPEELREAGEYARRYIREHARHTHYFALEGSNAAAVRRGARGALPQPISRVVRFVGFVRFDARRWAEQWRAVAPRERTPPLLLHEPVVVYDGALAPGIRDGETALLVRVFALQSDGGTVVKDALAVIPLTCLYKPTGARPPLHLFRRCAAGEMCLIPGIVAKGGLVQGDRIVDARIRADALRIACAALDPYDLSNCDGCAPVPRPESEWHAWLARARRALLRPEARVRRFLFQCPSATPNAACNSVVLRKRPTQPDDMPLFAFLVGIDRRDAEAVWLDAAAGADRAADGALSREVARTDFFRDDEQFRAAYRRLAGAQAACGPEFDAEQLDEVLRHLFERGYEMRAIAADTT